MNRQIVISPRSLERQRLDEEESRQDMHEEEREVAPLPQSVFSKERCLYALSVVILAGVLGSLHFSFQKQIKHQHLNEVVKHQEHDIYISNQLSHDRKCYTQGLSFINHSYVIESCGMYGESYFHILYYNYHDLIKDAKEVYKSQIFPRSIFLEGSTFFPATKLFYILTWRENIVYRFYQKDNSFLKKDQLKWDHEGWGITHNRTHLIISDGSNRLYVTDEQLAILKIMDVVDEDKHPQTMLNEIEYVQEQSHPYIYANVYLSSLVLKIDFKTGIVAQTYNLTQIVAKEPQAKKSDQVLNGIAYNDHSRQFFITGKRWKSIYVIESF